MAFDITKIKNRAKTLTHYRQQAAILVMAISLGLSLVLTNSMLNFWLAKEQIPHPTISLFSLINLPYCINFIWCPLLDKFNVPWLAQRLGHKLAWIFLLQILLFCFVLSLGCTKPGAGLSYFAVFAFIISLISATCNSLCNVLRSEISTVQDHGTSAGTYLFGYRSGMLLGSSGGIYASAHMSYQQLYTVAAFLILAMAFALIILLKKQNQNNANKSLRSEKIKLQRIFKPIGSTKYIFVIFLFLILYRMSDNFISVMLNPFLLDKKFTEAHIAIGAILYSSIGAMSGGLIGGYLMRKINIIQSLWYFGIAHSLTHLFFVLQSVIPQNLFLYFIASIAEGVTGGMAMTAYISFITSICKGEYKTTQQALFSSVMGISRSILPVVAGSLVSYTGWKVFFILVVLTSFASLVMLFVMKKKFLNHIYKSKVI